MKAAGRPLPGGVRGGIQAHATGVSAESAFDLAKQILAIVAVIVF